MTFLSHLRWFHDIAVIQCDEFINVALAWTDLGASCDEQWFNDKSGQSYVIAARVVPFSIINLD